MPGGRLTRLQSEDAHLMSVFGFEEGFGGETRRKEATRKT